jgi:hypothetical protein
VRCRSEKLLVVIAGQMLAQKQERRQVQLPALDHRKGDRELTDKARARHAPEGFVLAHAKPSGAKIEERRARRFEIQPPFFDLAEIGKKARKDHASLADERM